MYDVVVIGGGHAGCEASLIIEKMNLKVLLITGNINMLGFLSCNPSIGGPAKGIVVREVDALGGYMGKLADMCQIQTKLLNSSKGPAVQALRFQIDKVLYPKEMLKLIKSKKNIELKEAYVTSLIIKDNQVLGVRVNNEEYYSKKTIITTGTYLNSKIFQGHQYTVSGPDNQKTTNDLSNQLKELGFEIQRLKTGTPARVKTSTIDFSLLKEEPGSPKTYRFSFDKGYDSILNKNLSCYLTYTNKEIHDLIYENINESAMYSGKVEGVGPRYCPSIEDKLVRFKDKERHQIFFEPESTFLDETYIQGFSTSMPISIQDKMLRLLPGLKNSTISRYAYAIEYDAINPIELYQTLESKRIKGLYFAGQINGTSGYEEASGQGIVAGINAASSILSLEPLILKRDESYIGVLIDDLVTKGTKEPYRLLTSRAEYRLLLRHDNADLRLREYGYYYKTITEEQYNHLLFKKEEIIRVINLLKETKIVCDDKTNNYLEERNSSKLFESVMAFELIKRPEINYKDISNLANLDIDEEILYQVEIEIKYEGYIKKALMQRDKLLSANNKVIPDDIDYDVIKNLCLEATDKLKKVRPKTIGQAMRISGVNPSDIAILSVYVETLKTKK